MATIIELEQAKIIDRLRKLFPQIEREAITFIAEKFNFEIPECLKMLCEMSGAKNISSELSSYVSRNNDHNFGRIVDFIRKGYKVMVLMRGLPGSGKTYLAKKLVERGLGSIKRDEFIFSTDDFFNEAGRYIYDPQKLEVAHMWNQRRIFTNAKKNVSPIIIDNCNLEIFEMKVYCTVGVKFGYIIEVLEVATAWALNPPQLMLKNVHGVDGKAIESMLKRYERGVTAEKLLARFGLAYTVSLPQKIEYPTQADVSSDACFSAEGNNEVKIISEQLKSLKETILKQSNEIKETMLEQIEEMKETIVGQSEKMNDTILKQSEETKETTLKEMRRQIGVMKGAILNQSKKTKNTTTLMEMCNQMAVIKDTISKQSEEMNEIILKQSEEMKKIMSQLTVMKDTILEQSEQMKEIRTKIDGLSTHRRFVERRSPTPHNKAKESRAEADRRAAYFT